MSTFTVIFRQRYPSSLPETRHTLVALLLLQVPVIQIASANAQVAGKAEPSQVRDQCPGGLLIDLSPDVRQISYSTSQSDDVDRCFDRAVEAEEERHPDQIEAELNSVDRGSLLWYHS